MAIQIDMRDLQRQLTPLMALPDQIQAAVYQSIKKSMVSARTQIRKEIREKSTLAASAIKSAIGSVFVSTHGTCITGSILVISEPITLTSYQIAPRRQTAQRGKRSTQWRAVRWRTERGKGFADNDKKDGFSKAFAAYSRKGKRGKLGVYRRKGKELQMQMGPRVQYFAAFNSVQDAIATKAKEQFERTLAHEVQYRLQRLGGGR